MENGIIIADTTTGRIITGRIRLKDTRAAGGWSFA
jgi:hypothetical protein